MKKILIFPFLLFCVSTLAQDNKEMPHYLGHDSSIYLMGTRFIGFSYQDFDGLNSRLKNMPQYEQLSKTMGTIGMGSIHKIGHYVSKGGITLGYGRNGNGGGKRSTLGLIGLSMDMGYNFFKPTSRVELFPTVGLGFEGYKAWIKKDLSAIPFDSVLQYPATQSKTETLGLSNYFLTYRFGLNIGYSSPSKYFTIGLQAGYAGSFKDKAWKVNDNQTLANAPRDNISRFYGSLYMSKRINWRKKMAKMHM